MVTASFAHLALNCLDPIAVEKFYTRYFGFERVRVIELPDTQIVFTRSGHLTLEIFKAAADRPLAPPEKDGYAWPGTRHIAFQVESVDEKLRELGDEARVTLGPLDFDAFIPGWRTAWVADPEGNIVEITQGFVEQDSPPPLT